MPTSSSNRRDLVERRIYDLKYNTNFTASWYLVRGGVLLTSDGTLAEARSGCGVGLLSRNSTKGPLKMLDIDGAKTSPSTIPTRPSSTPEWD